MYGGNKSLIATPKPSGIRLSMIDEAVVTKPQESPILKLMKKMNKTLTNITKEKQHATRKSSFGRMS